jgi:DNA-binding LytR/AlgR family response regulator
VSIDDIDWIGAADNYVELHCGGVCHLVRSSLSEIESALDPEQFLRIHRSAIVNTSRVKEVSASAAGEYTILMEDGAGIQPELSGKRQDLDSKSVLESRQSVSAIRDKDLSVHPKAASSRMSQPENPIDWLCEHTSNLQS